MSSFDELEGRISIFFILDIPVPALREIFRHEEFREIPGTQPPTTIAPGISIGPPRLPISIFKNTRIEYQGDRSLLQCTGPLEEVIEVKEIVPGLFEEHKYSLKDITRYCEFMIPASPINIPKVVDKMRSSIEVEGIERLNEICGCEMKPFRLSLSNLDTPLNDEWFHISLQPDVNRPHDKMLVEIIKRTPKFDDMRKFLDKVKEILGMIEEIFSSG